MKELDSFRSKILGLIALGGIFCVSAFGIGLVKAAQALPNGGDAFGTAVTIGPGSYVTDREIAQNSFEYFKISITAGQGLTVKVTTPAGGSPYAGVIVYDSDQEEVGSKVIIGDSTASKTLTWVRSYEDVGIFYIAIGNEYDTNATGTTYAISVNDYYDADSQADAGGTFDTALKLDSAGTYQGYLVSEYGGTDEIDLYKLRVGKGAALTVSVTPPSDAGLNVAIYSSDREKLASGSSSNDGAIATASLSETLSSAADLYIEVNAKYETTEELIGYTLKISTEGGEPFDNGDTTTDGDTTADGAAKGTNWMLIGGGILALVVAAAVAVLLLKKKQPSQPPQPPQPPQPS